MKWQVIVGKVAVPVAISVAAALADVGLLNGALYQAVVVSLKALATLFVS